MRDEKYLFQEQELIECLYSNFIFCNMFFHFNEVKSLTFINLFAKKVKRFHLISLIKNTETRKEFLFYFCL